MKANGLYLFYYEFNAPLDVYVPFYIDLIILLFLTIVMYILKNNHAKSWILWW